MGFKPRHLLDVFRRDGGTHQQEVAEFAPVASLEELVSVTTVLMLASVGGKFPDHTSEEPHRWELVGGQEYQVSYDLADQLIVNGWAMGTLSREFSDDEVAYIRSNNQTIDLGGQSIG